MTDQTHHIVLVGDSIFDNGAYVRGGPDVVAQLRGALPNGARASLLAVDGATVADVARQLKRLPADTSLLVVSAGGNDALGHSHILAQRVSSVSEALARLRAAQTDFAALYSEMLDAVCAAGTAVAVCTIYDSAIPPPEGPLVVAALALFNDVITRAAFARGLPLIDLRLICDRPSDYANPIEPSVQGGAKIAAAIAAAATGAHAERHSRVIATAAD